MLFFLLILLPQVKVVKDHQKQTPEQVLGLTELAVQLVALAHFEQVKYSIAANAKDGQDAICFNKVVIITKKS